MKKAKGFEKHIDIFIKDQSLLALTFFDQIIYKTFEKDLMTYESKYDEIPEEYKDSCEKVRKIGVSITFKEEIGDIRLAFSVYHKLNDMIDKLECKVIIDDDVFVDGLF